MTKKEKQEVCESVDCEGFGKYLEKQSWQI